MRAAVYTEYGPPEVVRIEELDRPSPERDELLIRVHASTVSAGDVRMRSFDVPRLEWLFARLYLGVFGPRRPVLGMQLAGTVEAVGEGVERFQSGDCVFGSTFGAGFGGHAEYKCLPESGVVARMPATMSFAEAACVPTPAIGALSALRRAGVQPGDRVLVYGASGSVGTFAVQIARAFGAEVTGVCSTANVELIRSLGAAEVIDYTRDDVVARGERYDVVFDAVGKLAPSDAEACLAAGGRYSNIMSSSTAEKAEDLAELRGIVDTGELRSVIDRTYPLEQIVEAHRYVEIGHKKGNVVIAVVSGAP